MSRREWDERITPGKCGLCLKAIPPGEGVRGADYRNRLYCGESCAIAYAHRTTRVYHSVPDPRYHRLGDGWRGVRRWVNAKVRAPK